MSDFGSNGSHLGAPAQAGNSHEEFEELCALATTGELTVSDRTRLNEHLAHCAQCRALLKQYREIASHAMPMIASVHEAEAIHEEDPIRSEDSWSIERAEERLMSLLQAEARPTQPAPIAVPRKSIRSIVFRGALAASLLGAFSLAFYQLGRMEERKSSQVVLSPIQNGRSVPSPPPGTNTQAASTATSIPKGSDIEGKQVSELRSTIAREEREKTSLTLQLDQLNEELNQRNGELDKSAQDKAELNKELADSQANTESLQGKLNAAGGQSARDSEDLLILRTKISDLQEALVTKEKQIAQDQELLSHDRDIRNLIGARNLYIAEIYDVAKSGDTQKPFGRVFYTKDKSLIFYGYDLDQQHGITKNASFQAWGRRGGDDAHDVSLGLLYLDDADKRRWALKFNDPKTISQLDAVFITVEPQGGSSKPTTKPLLFTYLRLDPNHP